MTACDFLYDGDLLSEYGFVICSFDSSSTIDVISAGAEITFNTVPIGYGRESVITSIQYDSCFESTFQIGKNPANATTQDELIIDEYEARIIMRWLNRKQFLKFKLIQDDWADAYVEATFNLSRVEVGGDLLGFELHMITNRPYALMEPRNFKLEFTSSDKDSRHIITDTSDEIGYVYPRHMTISCDEAGDLLLKNDIEDRTMAIRDCVKGEVLTIDCKHGVIGTSVSDHKIASDFNYNFFRIANRYDDRENGITSSLACTVLIEYEPVAKVVF